MNILTEYFTSENKNRDIEYKTCIKENIKNPHIKKIFIFISDSYSKLDIESDKIEIVRLDKRPTFKFLIEYSNQNLPNEVCIISNTDIFFDDSVQKINDIGDGDFLALTRWDLLYKEDKWYSQFYNHPWRGRIGEMSTAFLSQDSWIFKSPIKVDDRSDFLMGRPGCDNRIVQIYHELGYDVKNPSMGIITRHLHVSNHRTYSNKDIVPGPYLLISPTNEISDNSWKQTIQSF